MYKYKNNKQHIRLNIYMRFINKFGFDKTIYHIKWIKKILDSKRYDFTSE